MDISLDAAIISQVDLSRFLPLVPPEYQGPFQGQPGEEHYKLLAHLSTLFNDTIIVDIGTDAGCSAMALSYNPSNRVISFDLENRRRSDIQLPNVEFRVRDALQDWQEWIGSPLISLDVAHEGDYEAIFYEFLTKSAFNGLLVLDDVYLNDAMKAFWASITHPKFDITAVGHWSGTGLVVFQ